MIKRGILGGVAAAALLQSGGAEAGTLWSANLNGANENPPTTAPCTATGFLILNDAETEATVYAAHNITIPLTGGHIHRGTAAVNGPIIFPFPDPSSPMGPLMWSIPAADVANLKAQGLYVNFHTQVNPSGAIRGTLLRSVLATNAVNPAQLAVANALDVSAGFDADLDQVLMAAAVLPSAAARTQALDEFSGRTVYAQGRQSIEAMTGFKDSLLAHAEEVSMSPGRGLGGFFKGGYAFGKRDADADQAGSKITRPYVLAGLDNRFGSASSVGVALGYADGTVEFRDDLGRTKAKTLSLQAYLTTAATDGLMMTLMGGYGWTNFDTTRSLASLARAAASSHDGSAWSVGLKVTAPFALDNDVRIGPYGMIDMQRAKVDAYMETDAGGAGLVVADHSSKNAAVEGGLSLLVPMGSEGGLLARVQGGWRHLLASGSGTVDMAFAGSPVIFTTAVLSPGKSAAHVSASMVGNLGGTLFASAGYHGTISSRTTVHALEARLGLRF